ncbi:MAG TPA: hypothetical protein VME67_25465 [Mycobacterium sp.]|nr:hypothetical protein [Mycobacterium sp.]HTX97890.1 hypothetical protein [Mycobacterium sp.]
MPRTGGRLLLLGAVEFHQFDNPLSGVRGSPKNTDRSRSVFAPNSSGQSPLN